MFSFFKNIFKGREPERVKDLIKEGAFLVDVRSPMEFSARHVRGSVNIPQDQIMGQIDQFINRKHIIVFCQSGGRSARAKFILESFGITQVTNAGSWISVNQIVEEINRES